MSSKNGKLIIKLPEYSSLYVKTTRIYLYLHVKTLLMSGIIRGLSGLRPINLCSSLKGFHSTKYIFTNLYISFLKRESPTPTVLGIMINDQNIWIFTDANVYSKERWSTWKSIYCNHRALSRLGNYTIHMHDLQQWNWHNCENKSLKGLPQSSVGDYVHGMGLLFCCILSWLLWMF